MTLHGIEKKELKKTTSNRNADTEPDEEDDQREGSVAQATVSSNLCTLSPPSEVGSMDLSNEQETPVRNARYSSAGRGRDNRQQRDPENNRNRMEQHIVQLIADLNKTENRPQSSLCDFLSQPIHASFGS
ncbi:hypothetical protein AB205_0028660 [Aquarana catesbeiana]|uniref:Uncharacterized protein n=1 Tax=Aquarana catesbeiana TaxID=8400 RepID=A0A2G9SAA3_AQUCT|nr:hypothetical protein AB205_0028660 [Aquarana catesbeiana]